MATLACNSRTLAQMLGVCMYYKSGLQYDTMAALVCNY